MGIDYIRGQAGKPYVKRWAKGLNRLKSPTLLDVNLSAESRVVTATLTPGCSPREGGAYLVQTTASGELAVMDGHRQIACVADPPADVTRALAAQHGLAPATVERIGGFGTTAELKLK
jgi:hypothetical protein